MAEAVDELPEAVESRRARRRRGRFLLAYGVLAVIVGGTAAALAVLVAGSDRTDAPAARDSWSHWRPTAVGVEGAQQIGNFVGRRYRLPGGRQLVAVRATPFAVQEVPISAVAIQTPERGDPAILVSSIEDGVVYAMCGLGRNCSIGQGKPSQQRGRLVRREGLELALYSFAYLEGVDAVVVFLPPPTADATSFALYFHRRDLEDLLESPVSATLADAPAPLATEIGPNEAELLDGLTLPHVFGYGFRQFQDGTLLLVLTPAAREE